MLTAIRAKHAEAIELLGLPAEDSDRIKAVVESDLSDIRVLLKAVRNALVPACVKLYTISTERYQSAILFSISQL